MIKIQIQIKNTKIKIFQCCETKYLKLMLKLNNFA